MAHRQGIAVTNSRFACLKIEDDEDEVKKPSVKQNVQQNSNNTAKKRDKKKNSKDAEELKKLAFGRGGSGKQHPSHQNQGKGDGGDSKDWDQWKAHDMEIVEEKFKDDLAQALLQSRLEEERKQQETKKRQERIDAGLEAPPTKEGRKKKKQKEKPQPMSLEQFKQLPKEKPVGSDESEGKAIYMIDTSLYICPLKLLRGEFSQCKHKFGGQKKWFKDNSPSYLSARRLAVVHASCSSIATVTKKAEERDGWIRLTRDACQMQKPETPTSTTQPISTSLSPWERLT
ncbi:hypothetical protein RRG08_012489 [Elysia crispata]|uniref:Uncharacterized protein n=1 Tax=Elysia crispata TaxID=231223 RepID=A0AAE1ANW1_9GAST|nr:hypothetical protein RRG08_012489 [Elysia crispata]